MTTTTATAKKPTPDKNDVVKSDKKTLKNDAGSGREDRNLSLVERKGIVGLGDMDDRLFEVYERIVPHLNRQRSSDAACMYEIGVHVDHVLTNENGYGRRAAENLAEPLGVQFKALLTKSKPQRHASR